MKNPITFILCFLVLTTTYAQEAKFAWMKQMNGNAEAIAMEVDAERNLYIAGSFTGQVDFDPGDSTHLITPESGGGMFILKLDSMGNFIWVYDISRSNTSVNIFDIALDRFGNVHTIGLFGSANGKPEVDFDPGPGVTTIGQYGAYVLKLRADGSFAWVRKQPAPYIYKATNSIAVDKNGNVYSTGSFFGTVDVDPGEGVFNLAGDDETKEIFISKLDSAGNFVWGKQTQTRYWDNYTRSGSVSVDTSGGVYLTGTFRAPMDVDPGPDTVLLTPRDSVLSAPGKSINSFVLKLDTAGKFVWAYHIMPDIENEAVIKAVAVDKAGSTVFTGMFEGSVDFDNDNPDYRLQSDGKDAFIGKLDTNGAIAWVKQINSTLAIDIPAITTDTAGSVYTTGSFSGNADFAPGDPTHSLSTSNVGRDIFIYTLDAEGKHGWLKQIGSNNNDMGQSIAVGNEGTVYTAGVFRDTVDFDPGPDMFKSITPKNIPNMYVHAMKQVVSPVGINENVSDNNLVVHTSNSGELLLHLPFKNIHEDVYIGLYSIAGDVLKEYSAQGAQRLSINLKGFASGQYILRIISGENVIVKTIHHIQ